VFRLFKYPGGKNVSIKDIQNVFRSSGSDIFIDVFGGSGNVILNVNASHKIYNDIDFNMYNFFIEAKAHFFELYNYLSEISKSPDNLQEYIKRENFSDGNDRLISAANLFVRLNISFGGMGNSYATREKSIYTQFIKKLENLYDVHNDIKNWLIENMDFSSLIDHYNGRDAFFYMDPPYPSKSWYNHNFSDSDYKRLHKLLKSISGKYLLNFYDSEYIRKIFGNPSFIRKYKNHNSNNEEYRYLLFYKNW
jgi:DNA adenine methylase